MPLLRKMILTLLFLPLISMPVLAAWDFPASPWTKEKTYADKMTYKLGFGTMNVLTGWTDLLFEPSRSGIIKGIPLGAIHFVTNVVGGVLHVGTFPIPVDIPLPDGGVNFESSRVK
ncbi:MAG: hypothetical protein HYZ84_06695 [Candidatus Omnitrophica bacterium]|nr:hypothetical protein [Candidatus Omnitrophota bacterium]